MTAGRRRLGPKYFGKSNLPRKPPVPSFRDGATRGGHGHGHPPHPGSVYILYTPEGVTRAHLQNRGKRTRTAPVLCMRWALGVMYIRSQSRFKSHCHVQSYGSDKVDMGMGMGGMPMCEIQLGQRTTITFSKSPGIFRGGSDIAT